jgi:hypothetical protein
MHDGPADLLSQEPPPVSSRIPSIQRRYLVEREKKRRVYVEIYATTTPYMAYQYIENICQHSNAFGTQTTRLYWIRRDTMSFAIQAGYLAGYPA